MNFFSGDDSPSPFIRSYLGSKGFVFQEDYMAFRHSSSPDFSFSYDFLGVLVPGRGNILAVSILKGPLFGFVSRSFVSESGVSYHNFDHNVHVPSEVETEYLKLMKGFGLFLGFSDHQMFHFLKTSSHEWAML